MLLSAIRQAEWIETDGLGGFAMETAGSLQTRRYHGLLLTAAPLLLEESVCQQRRCVGENSR